MDSPHRPPPPDAKHPTPSAVTGSAVPLPPQESKATDMEPRNSSTIDEDAVAGRRIRSLPHSAEARTATPKEAMALATRPSSVQYESTVTGFPASSSEKNHTASLQRVHRVSSIRDEAATASSVQSPSRSSENPKDTRAIVPRVSSLRDEAVTGSPVGSPHREAKQARYEHQNSFSSASSYRSPLRDGENPTASPHLKETSLGSPMRGAMTVGALLQSPLGDVAAEDPSLEKLTSPMVPVTSRMVATETYATKVGGRGGEMRGSLGVESGTSRQTGMTKVVVGLRILALVLSLISFSVMAADKTSGWDGDSFDRYREFRYCLSVNVLVFVYSIFQLCVHIHHRIMKRRLVSRPVSYSFDLLMDQILAYLLMSASSSAASRNGDWVSDFGSDGFTRMIDGSIAMSFLAFFDLAFSSIISAYKFFSWNS